MGIYKTKQNKKKNDGSGFFKKILIGLKTVKKDQKLSLLAFSRNFIIAFSWK